jgi:predicted dehydrogenase
MKNDQAPVCPASIQADSRQSAQKATWSKEIQACPDSILGYLDCALLCTLVSQTNIDFVMKSLPYALMLLPIYMLAQQPSPKPPVRIGIAGLVHTHVHWILGRAERGDIEIVGIAEPNQALAERYAKQHGFSMDLVYPDLESMLEATQPEAVTAFNTIYGHLEVVEACAPRGIHVMVEKPLAVNLEHARKMEALARKHKIMLLTNYETTWYGSNHRVKALVDGGALGPIRKMVIHDGHEGPIEIGCNPEFTDWLCDPKWNGGGALIDFGCYGANLSTWLMKGERPTSVFAVTQQIKPHLYPKVDDEATIVLTYPEAQAIIQASWNWPYSRKDMEVYGKSGAAFALDATRLQVRLPESTSFDPQTATARTAPYDDPFALLAALVRKTIPYEKMSLSSLENNMIVVEILQAAIQSAETGERVYLPLD